MTLNFQDTKTWNWKVYPKIASIKIWKKFTKSTQIWPIIKIIWDVQTCFTNTWQIFIFFTLINNNYNSKSNKLMKYNLFYFTNKENDSSLVIKVFSFRFTCIFEIIPIFKKCKKSMFFEKAFEMTQSTSWKERNNLISGALR